MSRLLGQMDQALVEAYRRAMLADVDRSNPWADLKGLIGTTLDNVKKIQQIRRPGDYDKDGNYIGPKKDKGVSTTDVTDTTDATTTKSSKKSGKTKSDPKVVAVQEQLLQLDPNALPKHGADGVWGDETQAAWDAYREGAGGLYRHGAGEAYTLEFGDKPVSLGGVVNVFDEDNQQVSLDPSIMYSEDFRPLYGEGSLTGYTPPIGFDTGFPKLASPLKQLGGQPSGDLPIHMPEAINHSTIISQIKSSNKVIAQRIKSINGSLGMTYFGAIKKWNQAMLEAIETEQTEDTTKQAIARQNAVAGLNETEKTMRLEYADVVLNNEVSNYAYDYMHGFISEYLSDDTARYLAKNPANGQYEYMFFSKAEQRHIVSEEIEKYLRELTIDLESQASILKQVNTYTQIAKNPAKKQPIETSFDSAAKEIVRKGRIESLIYDDMLNNGSSFFEDIKEHPAFQKPDVSLYPAQAFKKEKGEMNWYDSISEKDINTMYDIIVNPRNPMFNTKTDIRSALGLTEVLLVEYISGYFSDHYHQAKGTADKKPTEMVGQQSPIQKRQPMSKRDILKKYNL